MQIVAPFFRYRRQRGWKHFFCPQSFFLFLPPPPRGWFGENCLMKVSLNFARIDISLQLSVSNQQIAFPLVYPTTKFHFFFGSGTSLIWIMGGFSRKRSVAVGFIDSWKVKCDTWHVTCSLWHVKYDFFSFLQKVPYMSQKVPKKNASECLKSAKECRQVPKRLIS